MKRIGRLSPEIKYKGRSVPALDGVGFSMPGLYPKVQINARQKTARPRTRRGDKGQDYSHSSGFVSQAGRGRHQPGRSHQCFEHREGAVLLLLQKQRRTRARGSAELSASHQERKRSPKLRNQLVGGSRSLVLRAARTTESLFDEARLPVWNDRERGARRR